MKQIDLVRIKLSNFKSFRDAVFQFSGGPGFKLLSGDNRSEPRLGGNGAGKSSLWDAVCYALYGTSIKGLRTGDLVTYGQKKLQVELELWYDGEPLTIQRSGPPMKLISYDVNGEWRNLEQGALDRALGLTRERFLNSVLFGQAVPLFIDLPVPKRGELLDEVLDLGIWEQASEIARRRSQEAATALARTRTLVANLQGQLESIAGEDWDTHEAGWAADHRTRTEALIAKLEELERAAEQDRGKLELLIPMRGLDALWKEYEAAQASEADAKTARERTRVRLEDLQRNLKFFQDNGECPVCHQAIPEHYGHAHIAQFQREIAARQADMERFMLDCETTAGRKLGAHETWRAANDKRQGIERQRSALQAALSLRQREIESLERDGAALLEEVNPFTAKKQERAELRGKLAAQLAGEQQDELRYGGLIDQLQFWREGFKRVRLFCIKRVLDQLQLETMNAASALGLIGWEIKYATETENKSGSLRLGVQIDVRSPTLEGKFDAWSGGEGQRIRLCVALGLSSLIQRWAGVRFAFEVYDEPSAWLSQEGIEDLLSLLQNRAESQQKSIWVCDHRALQASAFTEAWEVIKDQQGSRIKLLGKTDP